MPCQAGLAAEFCASHLRCQSLSITFYSAILPAGDGSGCGPREPGGGAAVAGPEPGPAPADRAGACPVPPGTGGRDLGGRTAPAAPWAGGTSTWCRRGRLGVSPCGYRGTQRPDYCPVPEQSRQPGTYSPASRLRGAVIRPGHANPAQAPFGSRHAVLLAMRTCGGTVPDLSREPFLTRVTWEDGWPIINPGAGRLRAEFPAPLPASPWPAEPPADDVDTAALGPAWSMLRTTRMRFSAAEPRRRSATSPAATPGSAPARRGPPASVADFDCPSYARRH
jgi:hypothetical protein